MFVIMPRARPVDDVNRVLELKEAGYTDREVSTRTGVPVNTIRGWRNHGLPGRGPRALVLAPECGGCGGEPHDFTSLDYSTYSYLLGMYLGDGCITKNGTSWTLRVTLDSAYPGIIAECKEAVRTVCAGRSVYVRPHHGQNCSEVSSTWRSWPCLFPQHGAGRKHHRKIKLKAWQRRIVEVAPQPFLRGLIQTDGWRGLNRVHVKGKDYAYPRYQFSNRSDDIRRLFTDACDRLGVEWRQWTRYHVSVARRESVAYLDMFIGLKH